MRNTRMLGWQQEVGGYGAVVRTRKYCWGSFGCEIFVAWNEPLAPKTLVTTIVQLAPGRAGSVEERR